MSEFDNAAMHGTPSRATRSHTAQTEAARRKDESNGSRC